ncbi:four helix bundle protein [Kordia periserrulae]|uniref:Four helix bundle protein n=1 Tax=Kordia periserrulae TaxID=701523 RepID=A0A2T6BTU0_9FLAO|nr:four helix bundle protein [Kordia periserrulae]PTX59501.1 four helix bundle protein [Kordia periserrulae]
MRDFRKLDVWNSAIELVTDIYKILELFPNKEKFGLSSQLSRAVVSIPSNIAEGCAKDSQKDFIRFLKISLGSSFEVETQIIIGMKLGYIEDRSGQELIDKLQILQKRINALSKYAKTKT